MRVQKLLHAAVIGLQLFEAQRPAAVRYPRTRLELAHSHGHELAAPGARRSSKRADPSRTPAIMFQTHGCQSVEIVARRIPLSQSRFQHDHSPRSEEHTSELQ